MKGFMEGFLFRPQGKPMVFPYTWAAMFSQFPYKHIWHEWWLARYSIYALCFATLPLFLRIDRTLTGPENKKLWQEKRKHDMEHHRKELEKMWEVRT